MFTVIIYIQLTYLVKKKCFQIYWISQDIKAGEDTYSVDEGIRNIKITTLTASDVDSGQNHSFTIVSETQLFHVIGNELWVSLPCPKQ